MGNERFGASLACLGDVDGDGWTDTKDPDCQDGDAEDQLTTDSSCNDGLDNDGDGWIDTDDPDCPASTTATEQGGYNSSYQCNNNLDDDFDGYIDSLDPDCTSGFDVAE